MSATGGTFAWTDDAGVMHSLDRPGLRARTLTNLYSTPPLRGEDVVIASYPGEWWIEKQHSARRIDLELLIYDQQGVLSNVYNTLQELTQAFGIHTQGTLTHYRPDGTIVSASAQINSWTSPRTDNGPFQPVQQTPQGIWYVAVAPFNLADPYFYGATVTTGPTDISSGSAVQTVTNSGTVRGWKPVFTIAGPATSPKITNAANGWTLQVLVTVPSGQSLVVDCGAWTALLNGTSVIGSVIHSGGFPFLMLEPGSNPLTVTGGSTGATFTTQFASPYL